MIMISTTRLAPFYDPTKSYEDNYDNGPFGLFADGQKRDLTGKPSKTFLGHSVFLPFGIPAGPLLNSKFVSAAFEKGFDICTYKTVRTKNHTSHPYPNVLSVQLAGELSLERAAQSLVADSNYDRPDLSITNSFGVPSKNPDEWQPDMAKAVKSAGTGQVMIGSFQGTKQADNLAKSFIEDYVLAAKLVAETGAPILEANLSCPNEGTADLLCFDVERVVKIAAQIKSAVNKPLILKLAYFKDQAVLEKLATELNGVADGLSVINTIPAQIIDDHGQQALPGEGRAVSGVCGSAIKWAGLEMVARLHKIRTEKDMKWSLIGVGGVTQPEDYKEYRQSGADAVMSATGAMWNPLLAQEIWKGR
jgi:dihydroorotate dehydrogenase (NAD+) catalytic subunit